MISKLFHLLVFINLSNLVSCDQHENSTHSAITIPEFPLNLSVQEFEKLLDEITIENLEALNQNLNGSPNFSRQKRGLSGDPNYQPSDDFFKWYNDSLIECRESLKNLVEIETLKQMLNDVFYIDDHNGIHLNGDLTFDSLSILETLETPDVVSEDGLSHGEKFNRKFETVASSLNTIEQEVVKLNDLLVGAMKTNGNQQVSGNITFNHAYFDCGDVGCDIKSINTFTFNGRNVEELSSKVIRLNKDVTLAETFNFSHLVVDNLNVEIINNIDTADIVTRDRDHVIVGEVNFEGPVRVKQLNVSKTVNGHKISRETVLTTSDSQIITSPVTFSHDIIIKDLNVEGNLAQIGPDIDTFLSNVVQIGDNRIITGRKTFNDVAVDNLFVEGDTINGFNLTALSRHLLTRDDPQTIHSVVNVKELTINGNIQVDTINGNKLEEVIVRRHVPTLIRGDKVFAGPVHIRSMVVDGYINHHPIINRSLGLLLRRGPQVITGHKDFLDIEVKNVSLLHGNVGPLSFELLKSKAERMIQGGKDRVLSGPIELEDITVDGTINGIKLTNLMTDYLRVNETEIPNVNLNIARANFQKSLHCDKINGLKFPDDFITTNTEQFINDNIHLSSNLVITSALNLTYVNGYEVNAALWDSLTSSRDQIITATKVINGNLYVKNLNVTSFNNMNMRDLVLLNGNGIILGNKTFSSINVVGPSSVDSIEGVKAINSISFDELFSNSITKRNYQTISSNIHVKKLVIPMGTNIDVIELAGMKLDDILSSVVYLKSNKTQIIKGRKRFTSQANFGNLVFTSSFAGYSKDDFTKNYLTRTPSEINADISIDSDLFIENDLIVTGRINELNIGSTSRQFPINDKPIVITRPMQFRHVRIIDGNVESSTINGIKFGQEMITRKSAINFIGDASFAHGLKVNNLTVSSINNVTIEGPVCKPIQDVFTKPYSLTITGNVIAEQPIQAGNVNGRPFNRLTTNLIRGVKRFNKLNIKGPINLKGLLNNFHVDYLQKTYLSRTKNQTIDSEVILRNATFSGPVYIGGHLSGRNVLTNGIDILRASSMNLQSRGDQNIEGNFYFPGRVIFRKGLVNSPEVNFNGNDINFPRSVFLKDKPNKVNSTLIYGSLQVDDLRTSKRSNLLHDLNNLNPIIQFYGWKNFTSLEIDDLVVNYINAIPVSSYLRNDADANINATIAFKGDLVIKPNLTVFGSVNGIKLQILGSKLVQIGGNNTIEAPIKFKSELIARSMELPGPWRRDVSESLRELEIPKKLRSLKAKLFLNRGKLNDIAQYLEKQKNSKNETSLV
ncbi:uncharacterized protein LOC128396425 [Panonychus citri]|uniref:uncharacterized protein LOC128396425 n=1 Tax=Panonychus citri TaxID=50023 RepID=UPI00230818B5|nr:uncharacterized protein LOC128396425 [Panonychus citri]